MRDIYDFFLIAVISMMLVFAGLAMIFHKVNELESRISFIENDIASDLENDYARWRCTQFQDYRCVQYTERKEHE